MISAVALTLAIVAIAAIGYFYGKMNESILHQGLQRTVFHTSSEIQDKFLGNPCWVAGCTRSAYGLLRIYATDGKTFIEIRACKDHSSGWVGPKDSHLSKSNDPI